MKTLLIHRISLCGDPCQDKASKRDDGTNQDDQGRLDESSTVKRARDCTDSCSEKRMGKAVNGRCGTGAFFE